MKGGWQCSANAARRRIDDGRKSLSQTRFPCVVHSFVTTVWPRRASRAPRRQLTILHTAPII
jgi:hypothetical protein